MDLKQLTALVTVAETGSVTKAARLLHLVQPSVTRQIKLLEEEVGVPLFERHRQGMTPTPAGQVLVDRARRALLELDRARAEIRPTPEGVRGIVTVGLLESVIEVLAEPLLRAVTSTHPGIELRLITAYSGHLQQWLDAGDVDLSLLYDLSRSPSLAVVPLLEEELWAVAPVGSGLDPGVPVACADLLDHPLVLPVPGHGLRTLFDQAILQMGRTPRLAVQVNSMHLQKRLVSAGHGWTLLPAAGVWADVDAGLLEGSPLRDPVVSRQVVLGFQRAGRVSPAVEAVTAVIGKVVRRLVRERRWAGATSAQADTGLHVEE